MAEHGSRYAIINDITVNHGTVVELVEHEDKLRPAKQGEQRVRVPLGIGVGDRFRWHRESLLAQPAQAVPEAAAEPELEPVAEVQAKPKRARKAK